MNTRKLIAEAFSTLLEEESTQPLCLTCKHLLTSGQQVRDSKDLNKLEDQIRDLTGVATLSSYEIRRNLRATFRKQTRGRHRRSRTPTAANSKPDSLLSVDEIIRQELASRVKDMSTEELLQFAQSRSVPG